MEVAEKSPGSDTGTSHGDSSGAHSFIHVEIPTDGAMPMDAGRRSLDDTKRYPHNVEYTAGEEARVRQRSEAESRGPANPSASVTALWSAPPTVQMRLELERAHAQAAEHASLCHE